MTRSILHMITPLKHISPFDVNMAADAGFDVIVPYAGVELGEVRGLVQDSIFSRSPADGARTSIFFGGKRAGLALDMLDAAREAFVPPFRVNLFADPAGSFTTGAAVVAVVQRILRNRHSTDLAGKTVAIYGGTGVVAYASAVIAAQEGARPVLVGHDGEARVRAAAADMKARFGVDVGFADGSDARKREAASRDANVIVAAVPAGVNVLTEDQIVAAGRLLVAADVNAVPPAGLEGVGVTADGASIGPKASAIGALTIGHVKYRTENGLFRRMIAADKAITLDFRDAYALARDIAG
jgi:methylene-tetrahydromethanopterin dehydrogenase